MCVRYTLHKPEAALSSVARALKFDLAPQEWLTPRYNVALTSVVPVVLSDGGGPRVTQARWGFPRLRVPGSTPSGPPHANAKAETARTLRTFAAAAAASRCLVPANGFYEWKHADGRKWPYLFTLADSESFSFAGLSQASEDGLRLCFLTTAANADMAGIHNRMPVVLSESEAADWLGDAPLADETWQRLTEPPPQGTLASRPVDPYVGNTRNEGPRCHEPPRGVSTQIELF